MSERSGPSGEPTTAVSKPGKKKIPGVISIDEERCKGCGYCVAFCPLGVLAMAVRFNSKGYHYPEIIDAEKCSGCDLCGMYCPDFAIHGSRDARSGNSEESETE